MEEEVTGDGSQRIGETEPAKDIDADRVRLEFEFANLLSEIEERLAEEAGYGHGV